MSSREILRVTAKQLAQLKAIRATFPVIRKLPSPSAWRNFSHNYIWMRIVSQVVVVGGAGASKGLWRPANRNRIAWDRVRHLRRSGAARCIWGVLRNIGARYAGRTVPGCRKTSAILRNLDFLREYRGGPKGFVRDLAKMKGDSYQKVAFVSRHLSFIKHKGARDLLTTSFGLTTAHIALDSRVVGVLRHLGIRLPSRATSDGTVYKRVEKELVRQVCYPLRLTAAELDQLLFYNYEEIKQRF